MASATDSHLAGTPLRGKTVVLGVTGSIAAFKAPHIVTRLKRLGANVVVVMTRNATRFVTPLTFETLSGTEVVVDMFPDERKTVASVGETAGAREPLRHVSLAESTDLAIVAPATANIIGKMANGIADDFLSTELMAMTCPIVVAPAMNVRMMESDTTRENVATLARRGVVFVDAEVGRLASGAVGKGRLADPDEIVDRAIDLILPPRDLSGRVVVVTAGPTEEPIDPVRHIGNRSSGRMGFAVAERALRRGAEVIVVCGPTEVTPPPGVEVIRVRTTAEMLRAVLNALPRLDLLVMAAAPADYRPVSPSAGKIKKTEASLTLRLARTEDILTEVGGAKREGQGIVGFALETDDELEEGKRKLEDKDLDLIVVNNPTTEGAGFAVDTNVATLIGRSGGIEELPRMPKLDLADAILSRAIAELGWS